MFNLADFLLGEGHQVIVYAMSRGMQSGWESLIVKPGFTLIARQYKSEKTSLLSFFASMRSLSRSRRFDYVFSSHTHVNAALSFMRSLRILQCQHLVSRESTFVFERFFGVYRMLMWSLYKFFYGKQDLLICQTDRMRESLLSHLKFAPVRSIVTIPNPVNVEYIRRLVAQVEPQIKRPNRVIVACGRLIPIKAFDMLVCAFARVASDVERCDLIIIGDGPEKEKLQGLIGSLGMSDRIKLVGRLGNPIAWFAQADIGVVCSVTEGFPNVLIEMMASGTKNIISTPCSDGVFDLPNVTILKAHSENEMVETLKWAINNTVDQSDSYREHIIEKRTVESFWTVVQANCAGVAA